MCRKVRSRFPSGAVLLCLALSLTGIARAQGVDNPNIFQMDGDAQRTGSICFLPIAGGGPAIATPGSYPTGGTPSTSTCPTVNPSGSAATWTLVTYGAVSDDWSSFGFSGSAFTTKAHSLFIPSFVTDRINVQSDDTFLGTASKDIQDISQWSWNPHGTQDKDDIAHAYAGAYILANGHTAIYAGMDRFANSGDSTAGFWFVQDSTFTLCTGVGQSSSGPNAGCTASGTFLGHHTDGDLLLVSDFSIGGAVSTINVFVWQGGGLVLDATRSPAPCDPISDNNSLCGLVNNAFTQVLNNRGNPVLQPVTVATGGWSFSGKGGNTAFATGEFLEISVDLNQIFGANLPCFSTFFSETRSSTSVNASLSDLTTPVSFPFCSMSVTKACTGSSIVNGSQIRYNFSGSVLNTGIATIYSPTVYDTPPASIVGALTLNQPSGSIPGGGSASYSGSFVSSTVLSSTDLNLVSVAASSNSSGTPLNVVCGTNPPTSAANACANWGDPTAGTCPPTITKALSISKACKSCLATATNSIVVKVSEAFKVCNTGNVNVTGITVVDCPGGTISGPPGSPVCSSGPLTTVATIASLAAGACSGQLSGTYTPTSTSQCGGTGTCTLSDQAIAYGTAALGGGTVSSLTVSASCPVCPVQTDCPTNPPVAPCPVGATCQ